MSKTASNAARLLAQKRWEGTTPEERVEVAKLGGRPRKEKRCFCGANTMERAASIYFTCCRKAGIMTLHTRGQKHAAHD